MKVVELVIDENSEGVKAISVVDRPAIEENFIALSAHEVELKEVNTEKRILMGAALIPEKRIPRRVKEQSFAIYFSEQTVRKASELFLMNGNQSNATEQHLKAVDGMTVVESWIIDNPEMDKSKVYNFNLPKGTWMISMKVENDDVWSKVKSGEIKGFSIEGYFADKVDLNFEASPEQVVEQIKKILSNG